MADGQKIYADWLDIPGVNGTTQRTWFRDAEARDKAVDVLAEAIGTMTVTETGDITIQYDDGTEEEVSD